MVTHQDDSSDTVRNREEGAAPNLPEIAVSRASSLASSKRTVGTTATKKACPKQPAACGVNTDRANHPPWKAGYHHSETWKRSHQPDPEWRNQWSEHCFQNGRVLIIDYVSNESNVRYGGRRHITVATQGIQTLSELKPFYSDSKRAHDAALRNWQAFPTGRSWRGQTDPRRNVSRAAFGLDYTKNFVTETPRRRKRQKLRSQPEGPVDAKLMHLDGYEDNQHASYGYNTCVQRLSVYVHRDLGPPSKVSPDIDIKNPCAKQVNHATGHLDSTKNDEVLLKHLDNGNTVIVFENSASMQLQDCIVQLSFYLMKEDVLNDSRLAAQCTNFIMVYLFHGLGVDKIYDDSADESRAPELWQNQASWLKGEKIVWLHSDLAKEMQEIVFELANVDDEENDVEVDWMGSTSAEFERLQHKVSEDLVQPTSNSSDLMYESVGIRDSRQSLQLGLSMWRLSWITFILLPSTFIVGSSSMNVDHFKDNPGVGWYFVAATILMALLLILWYSIKHSLQRKRQTPYQRGLYEALFDDLGEEHPDLWTSGGAVDDIDLSQMSFPGRWRETISELAKFSTNAAVAEAEPIAAQPLSAFGLRPLTHEELRRQSEDRPSSRGSSGIIIEEKILSDSDSDAGERAFKRYSSGSRRAS
ncbi:hypothetical protein DOTSEDRAFT_89975 [Dothistroma septosporum NZE10]|uniref:Uncharacterized protein n=1 Tax=Dothistroma septosporum (strain NZE10 / CBS 128990) TaxID=675120 RepID=N1PM74_DOTSN|nr:hypothetical protein DOTSEDRAFT_89975 [Dothistroma septosporum NZE10]